MQSTTICTPHPDFIGGRIETIGDILLIKLYHEFVVNVTRDDVAGMLADIENII